MPCIRLYLPRRRHYGNSRDIVSGRCCWIYNIPKIPFYMMTGPWHPDIAMFRNMHCNCPRPLLNRFPHRMYHSWMWNHKIRCVPLCISPPHKKSVLFRLLWPNIYLQQRLFYRMLRLHVPRLSYRCLHIPWGTCCTMSHRPPNKYCWLCIRHSWTCCHNLRYVPPLRYPPRTFPNFRYFGRMRRYSDPRSQKFDTVYSRFCLMRY